MPPLRGVLLLGTIVRQFIVPMVSIDFDEISGRGTLFTVELSSKSNRVAFSLRHPPDKLPDLFEHPCYLPLMTAGVFPVIYQGIPHMKKRVNMAG